MSSDSRWTGGAANRSWQSGTRFSPVVDTEAISAQVGRYLADCKAFKAMLNPAHHPTEEGCLKVVFHQGHAQEQAIREAFRAMGGGRR